MRKNVIKGIILGTIVLFASPVNALAADMYSIGDGAITHASNYDTGVIVSDEYYSTPYGAVIY